jgi:hypothetical protein
MTNRSPQYGGFAAELKVYRTREISGRAASRGISVVPNRRSSPIKLKRHKPQKTLCPLSRIRCGAHPANRIQPGERMPQWRADRMELPASAKTAKSDNQKALLRGYHFVKGWAAGAVSKNELPLHAGKLARIGLTAGWTYHGLTGEMPAGRRELAQFPSCRLCTIFRLDLDGKGCRSRGNALIELTISLWRYTAGGEQI